MVQELRKTVRRHDILGEANPLTGKMFCADCGAKTYNHRHRTARYRKDIYPKGKGRWIAPEDDYNCSNYNLGRQKYRQQCSSHGIQTKTVNALVLETIKETCACLSAILPQIKDNNTKQIVSTTLKKLNALSEGTGKADDDCKK